MLAISSAKLSAFFSMPSPRSKRTKSVIVDCSASCLCNAVYIALNGFLVLSLTKACSSRQFSAIVLANLACCNLFLNLLRLVRHLRIFCHLSQDESSFLRPEQLPEHLHASGTAGSLQRSAVHSPLQLPELSGVSSQPETSALNHNADLAASRGCTVPECLPCVRNRRICRFSRIFRNSSWSASSTVIVPPQYSSSLQSLYVSRILFNNGI